MTRYALFALVLCACSDPIQTAPREALPLMEAPPPALEYEIIGDVEVGEPILVVTAPVLQRQQPATRGLPLPEPDLALVEAIGRELAIHLPSGRVTYVLHCRSAPGDGGAVARCLRRVRLFAQYFQAEGEAHGIDPWVLAAMAKRESGFNPMASGGVGEHGVMQLHPRGPGARSRFVTNRRFRERCQREPGACQRAVVSIGADLMGRVVRRCGNVEAALGAYNTGRCGGNPDYARRVLRTLERMRTAPSAAGG